MIQGSDETPRSPAARSPRWSSQIAVYLGTAGASVGLGSLWRFPYLAGTGGGSAFILVFFLSCLLIATPLLVAELAIGRRSRASPPQAAGIAVGSGGRSRWNAIGILGTLAAYLIFSYYTLIAGWVLAYTWKCANGMLAAAGPQHVSALWQSFRSNPLESGAWHAVFVLVTLTISSRGLQKGIEPANRIRAPGLLLLLVVLVIYSWSTGDIHRAFAFAFAPRFSDLNAQIALAAVGQAFYATGVGQAMMIAFGAYIDRGTSLIRVAFMITAAILLVSLLATVMIFPLVFGYGMNPAQGPELVFEVLPRVFTEMPGGRLIGTLFFALLVLAALTPSIALLEPAVYWLMQRRGMSRAVATWIVGLSAWILGVGSVLSFSSWADWHPLGALRPFAQKTFFDLVDYSSSNILLPVGALLTSLLTGWRAREVLQHELAGTSSWVRKGCTWLLRYVCPIAILVLFIAALS
ncbi:MAG: sodium-dependent transporter [Sinobacteraceae bacterium]|nr:sodium-dependent transporter [Nevskiaceae bacterium]MBV9911807.1 sodium-dependent transporter [Nevskiaceae bacterium]